MPIPEIEEIFPDYSDYEELLSLCGTILEEISGAYDYENDKEASKIRRKIIDISIDHLNWTQNLNPTPEPSNEDNFIREMISLNNVVFSLENLGNDISGDDKEAWSQLESEKQFFKKLNNVIEEYRDKINILLKPSAENVYILRISLNDVKPSVWRKVQVPGNATLNDLHDIIQTAMGWTSSHLHSFLIDRVEYQDSNLSDGFDYGDYWEDDNEYTLDSLGLYEKQTFRYTYDFGDDWRHKISVSEIIPAAEVENAEEVKCLGGKNACPPEDCGGPWGYEELLELLKKPEAELDDEDRERLEWCGVSEPDDFDIEEVNKILARF
jgi:hypothetical protein